MGEKLLEDIRKNGSGICPVCGSQIQGDVSKIVTRGEDVPVEDDVKAAEERSRKAKAEFDKKHSEFERYKAQSEEKRAELVKNLQKLLGDSVADQALADGYLENQAEAEEAQKQQAIAERKQAEENVKEKEKQEKNKERFEEQLHKFDENINIENENLAAVNKDIAASSEKIKGIEEQLKGESAEEVEKEIKSKEEKCKAIEKILSDHKIRKEKLDKDKNVITGSLVKINEDIPKDQANKKSISEELENKLAEDEFDTTARRSGPSARITCARHSSSAPTASTARRSSATAGSAAHGTRRPKPMTATITLHCLRQWQSERLFMGIYTVVIFIELILGNALTKFVLSNTMKEKSKTRYENHIP